MLEYLGLFNNFFKGRFIIPAAQETEIRRIMVWEQPKQKVIETPILISKPGVAVYACNPSYGEGHR
jgi:hypothetical protein